MSDRPLASSSGPLRDLFDPVVLEPDRIDHLNGLARQFGAHDLLPAKRSAGEFAGAHGARTGINFSPGELSIIHEASYGLTSEGLIAPGPNWPKFLSNIRFSFRILAKALSYDRWPKREVTLPWDNEKWGA